MAETDFVNYATIAAALRDDGHALLPKFLDSDTVAALAAHCRALATAEALQPAATGRGTSLQRSGVRGDSTRWLDAEAPLPLEQAYWSALQPLRATLNRQLLLGLESVEAHYALYPPGTGYARHRDRFRDDDARVLSSVLYLNQGWDARDGGHLRLYLPGGDVDVVPQGGTLALFLSAEIEHEVLPATRERLSIAGWFRRRT